MQNVLHAQMIEQLNYEVGIESASFNGSFGSDKLWSPLQNIFLDCVTSLSSTKFRICDT